MFSLLLKDLNFLLFLAALLLFAMVCNIVLLLVVIVIPPVYEVYKGYIVFTFSVCV